MSNEVKQTQQFVLRAMAKNYAGGHNWDHLDSEACVKAADEIRALEAECERWKERCQYNADTAHAVATERDALHTQLEEIRAAGGEEVEVVACMRNETGTVTVRGTIPADAFDRLLTGHTHTPLYALPPLTGKVAVPRGLLETLVDGIDDYWRDNAGAEAFAELRALLAGQQAEVKP